MIDESTLVLRAVIDFIIAGLEATGEEMYIEMAQELAAASEGCDG